MEIREVIQDQEIQKLAPRIIGAGLDVHQEVNDGIEWAMGENHDPKTQAFIESVVWYLLKRIQETVEKRKPTTTAGKIIRYLFGWLKFG